MKQFAVFDYLVGQALSPMRHRAANHALGL